MKMFYFHFLSFYIQKVKCQLHSDIITLKERNLRLSYIPYQVSMLDKMFGCDGYVVGLCNMMID